MADWQAIETEYITTDTSYRKLAHKYGLDQATVAVRGKKEDWVGKRKRQTSETQATMIKTIEGGKIDRAGKLAAVADKLLAKVEGLIEDDTGLFMANPQTLKNLSGVLKDIKDIQMVRSSADMREQEARIANLRRQAEKDTTEAQTVTVRIEGGDEAWRS